MNLSDLVYCLDILLSFAMAGDGLSVMVLTYPFMQSFSQVLNFPLIFIISFLTFKLQIFMYLSGCQAKEIHSEVIHMDMYHNKK